MSRYRRPPRNCEDLSSYGPGRVPNRKTYHRRTGPDPQRNRRNIGRPVRRYRIRQDE